MQLPMLVVFYFFHLISAWPDPYPSLVHFIRAQGYSIIISHFVWSTKETTIYGVLTAAAAHHTPLWDMAAAAHGPICTLLVHEL